MGQQSHRPVASRRTFLQGALWAGAAAALMKARAFQDGAWLQSAQAATADLTHDTYNGLLAFIIPGPDAYSVRQGVSTPEPGAVDAGLLDVFIATVDESTPFVPSFSAQVAAILNSVALSVSPAPVASFVSPFAELSFAEKAAVFQIMDGTESLALLGGLLPLFVAFFGYSEAGAFDPTTRTLKRKPLGWTLSHYSGAADGRDELLGYFPGVLRHARDL
jgi:hypothetical protein